MNNNIISTDTKLGTLNGTLLVLLFGVNSADIFKSCLLAATGATVSFTLSLLFNWAREKIQKRKKS